MRVRHSALLCVPALLLLASAAQAGVRVQVEGLGPDERGNVEARLSIRQQESRDDLDQALVERLHQQAPGEIRTALQPYGWYSPEVTSELTGQKPNWTVHYKVDAGPPTQLEEKDIDLKLIGEGAEADVFKDALRRIRRRFAQDSRLHHADYEDAKSQLADAAYQGGYLDAHWETSELRVNPEARQAQVILHLQTGPRYRLGKITLEQDQLDDKFINRYIRLHEGENFDPQRLLEQQFALSDLGYFQSVEVEPRRAEADAEHRVPIVIHTSRRKRHRYETGAGYGTDTGARLVAGTEWRRVNRYGHNLDADARISQIKNSAAANYRIPLGNEPGENVALTAVQQSQDLVDDGESNKYTLGVSLNRKRNKWQRRTYLEFSHERSVLGNKDPVETDLLTPGLSLERTKSDDPIFAKQGWYLFTDVHGAQKNLGSDTTFVRGYALGRAVYSFDWRTRLLGRVELGANFQDKFSALPATQRFFAGGDNSVRGYAYQSLATKDEDGNVIGGKYLTTFSVELERRIIGNWGAAAFLDAGGADDLDIPPKLSYGTGLGVRYRAPVGTFQVDLAHPLSDEKQAQFLGLRLHVGVRIGL